MIYCTAITNINELFNQCYQQFGFTMLSVWQ